MSDRSITCSYCETANSDLRRCTGCFKVYYCSKDCQRLDWSAHRKVCLKPTKTVHDTELAHDRNPADLCSGFKEMKSESTKPVSPNEPKVQVDMDHTTQVSDAETAKAMPQPSDYTKHESNEISSHVSQATEANVEENSASDSTEMVYSRMSTTDEVQLTEDEKRVLAFRQKKHAEYVEERNKYYLKRKELHTTTVQNFTDTMEHFHQVLTPAQMEIFEKRPQGSLDKAIHHIQTRLPNWNIIQSFDEIPFESHVPYMNQTNSVLVAFMFMYHHHVMRHGVYLKDAREKIMHAEFYFDHLDDDPWPYFTYEQVRPGDYIFIKNPVQHVFGDGIIGFRINFPSEVLFARTDSL